MAQYAKRTKVPSAQTRSEIEALLAKHGADGVRTGYYGEKHSIEFLFGQLRFRVSLTIPKDDAAEGRRRWRALLMVIKAKLVAVDDEISTLEEEFMSWVEGKDGKTLGETLGRKLENLRTTNPSRMLENLKIG